jgi:ATP-dependent DNA helicase RecQ
MISAQEILKEYWGFSTFRDPQEEIIAAVIARKDVITLLPTGGGKSICFQVPALVNPGTCLVISPLIALMQDQVENLKKRNIKATRIPSGISQDEMITLFDNIKFGNYKFLYISPERLQARFIQQKLKEININLIAIDEAHCISEWGHDFRPSYRNIKVLRDLKPNVPFIALTATANQKVLNDISKNLELKDPTLFKKSFFRENLAYQIFEIEDKLQRIIQIFNKTKKPAIVYVNSRKRTEEISNFLNANNFKSTFYHAGLPAIEKQLAFNNWMTEKTPIIVATNAFGMGIDKPNVGVVIHFNLPSSIENYIQETGRAGRNGEKSFAVLLQNENDILLFKERSQKQLPSLLEIKEIHKKLYQYFRIAKGEIFEKSFDFNLKEFAGKYKFSGNKVDTALKILSNNGVLEIGNQYHQKSSLQFLTSSKKVLDYVNKNSDLKKFTNALLRTYGGLFEQETTIDAFFIAKKASITTQQVFRNLNRLQEEQLVNYKPVIANASIVFLVPREDDRTINRCAKEIEQYIYQKKKKAADLIAFIKNTKHCRVSLVLSYFNEDFTGTCGACDVCLQNKKTIKTGLSETILSLLTTKKELTSQEITSALAFNEQEILIHLRSLLATGKITLTHQNKFQRNK